VPGGIQNETVRNIPNSCFSIVAHHDHQAQVIRNIGAILEEAGTSWKYVLKTTIMLATIDDYAAMNEVYEELIPDPKPARTAVEVGHLPGNFSIEIEAIAALPWW
jgi:reactive intermediate/imine deaminase